VSCAGGRVRRVTFRNVASYVIARKVAVQTSRGPVLADLSYGGASYASVDASSVGLAVDPAHHAQLIAIGREIKWALNDTPWARHPSDRRLDGIYGTILIDDLGENENGPHQRNVTVFADGEVDRSPCGSGTSARIALLADDGRLALGQTLTHDSIIGTTFLGRVVATLRDRDSTGLITEIEGMAYQTGTATFSLDPDDSLGTGFLLR
jgi:proline racemase